MARLREFDTVNSSHWPAPEVLAPLRRRIRQKDLGYRPLAPNPVGCLNDRNGTETA